MQALFFLPILLILFSGCANNLAGKYSVILDNKINKSSKSILNSGQLVAVQKKKHVVSLYIDQGQIASDLSTSIYIAVKNNGTKSVIIDPEDLKIEAITRNSTYPLLQHLKHEVLAKEKQRYKNQIAFETVTGALRAATASYSASTTYHSGIVNNYGTINGYIGSTPIYGNYNSFGAYTATSYNPELGRLAANVENINTEQTVNNIYDRMNAHLFDLEKTLLDKHVIKANKTYAGVILTKPTQNISELENIKITVPLGAENYVFIYNVFENAQ